MPLDLTELRGLPAQARPDRMLAAYRQAVRELPDEQARDWPGRAVAIFLVALLRDPAYFAAIIDHRHAGGLPGGAGTDRHAGRSRPGPARLGGWCGLEAHRVNERAVQRAQVEAVGDPPAGIAARLRFPLASGEER